jgi:hypothetical protein
VVDEVLVGFFKLDNFFEVVVFHREKFLSSFSFFSLVKLDWSVKTLFDYCVSQEKKSGTFFNQSN